MLYIYIYNPFQSTGMSSVVRENGQRARMIVNETARKKSKNKSRNIDREQIVSATLYELYVSMITSEI